MKRLLIGILLLPGLINAQSQQLKDFQSPPQQAKPRVWWHWMNGNISKEGIQKDLDWFEKTGIGGFQNFDANLLTPVVVPKKLVFMTPEWKDAFKFTTELAKKKGLEMAIAGSPGWSVTGGTWVKPEEAMKKYVWTETSVKGGQKESIKLTKPSDIAGKYQSAPYKSESFFSKYVGDKPVFYQDAMVFAFRIKDSEKAIQEYSPKVSASGGEFNLKLLTDGDLSRTAFLPPMNVGEDMWIQYEFDSPQTFKAASIAGAITRGTSDFTAGPLNRSIKVSDDGKNFREIASFSGSIVPFNTISFPATTSKFWRIAYKTLPGSINVMAAMSGGVPKVEKSDGVEVAEFVLYDTDRIDQIEDKAGFTAWRESYNIHHTAHDVDAIPINEVLDVTDKMNADGVLEWDIPAGNWKVVRLGYSLTGRQNHPASPEATGLEVDKLDKNAVRKYINTYLDLYNDATGGKMGKAGLEYLVLDSYEAGHMTWTKLLPDEFKKRRGYDLKNWMPVLVGRVVKDLESSEKFLWDFRRTIGEMIVENHYEVIGEELVKRGMKRYTESHENGRIFLADGMDVKRNAEIPMAAMWTPGSSETRSNNEDVRSEADIRESASVANIYGKPIVAAESFTSIQNAFSWYPEKLKRTADLELASGLNRFVIHTSVHQPLDDKKPGISLGPFGQYFTRHETWAGAGAKAWMDYLGRSSYLLQQGKNIADILYYYGENTNITWLCREKLPSIPKGFEFDFVNSSALLNAINIKNGKLTAKSGNTYQVLMLDSSARYMTLPVLRKIKTLANAGIEIIGIKPEKSPSLSDDEVEFTKLSNEIWALPNVKSSSEKLSISPDVIVRNTNHKILYRHRQSMNQDIYWFNNRSDNSTLAEVSFKINGKIPELWNPQTGQTESVSFKIVENRTIIPLSFEPWDAYFIIFKDKTSTKSFSKKTTKENSLIEITSGWNATFNDKLVDFPKLISWTESPTSEIKYFSGTATYHNKFNLVSLDKTGKYILDLGEVSHVAEVIINGINVGTLWKKPFKLDISQALRVGENSIEIKVTNLWVNRLIGDAQPNTQKTTFTTIPFYRKDSPLVPSGLLSKVGISLKK